VQKKIPEKGKGKRIRARNNIKERKGIKGFVQKKIPEKGKGKRIRVENTGEKRNKRIRVRENTREKNRTRIRAKENTFQYVSYLFVPF
jgi:hypothetical protein